MDAIDELKAYRKQFGHLSRMLRRVYRFHKTNPQVLDFLVLELQGVRDSGWTRASVGSLWHHARWVLTQKYRAPGETFVMANNFFPYYERIIVILHSEFNQFFEMAKSRADADFGTMLEPILKSHRKGYVRRLLWASGAAIDDREWQPTTPHVPKPVSRRERVRRKPQGAVTQAIKVKRHVG